ncbi:Uncharacterised protein [Comamonas testosteroni]|uniref:Uncharacterized protein n=1 Tax=Comamonas testosteroni TaxID=285 RepID=A0A8B4SBD2_COMTE|nr:Uncharacterised protein [Comamonas testosteroni]
MQPWTQLAEKYRATQLTANDRNKNEKWQSQNN